MTTCQGRDCHNLLAPPGRHRERLWCSDRCRKTKYSRPCEDCGKPLNGSNGHGPGSGSRCVPCSAIANGEARKIWTTDAVVLAIQEWAYQFGGPPAERDWDPGSARRILHDPERAARFEANRDRYPTFMTVVREFGSWNAGLAAAGFQPRPRHGGGGNELRRRSMRAKAAA